MEWGKVKNAINGKRIGNEVEFEGISRNFMLDELGIHGDAQKKISKKISIGISE